MKKMFAISTIKRQMKEAAGDVHVASASVDEVLTVLNFMMASLVREILAKLKKKKTVGEDVLKSLPLPELEQSSIDSLTRSETTKCLVDMLNEAGSESNYKLTRDCEDWMTGFVNDYVYTLTLVAKKEASRENKKTIQPVHVKLAHRDFLIHSH